MGGIAEPPFAIVPIGMVHGGRSDISDDGWGSVAATIVLAEHVDAGVLDGLDAFSHLEVIFLFHLVDPGAAPSVRRRPRGRDDLPMVGALAQRNSSRLGLSRCEIVAVEDRTITVRGLDAIDGTPVLDIKPWFTAFGPRGLVSEPGWVAEITSAYYSGDDD